MDKEIRAYYTNHLTAWLKSVYFSLAINGQQNRDFWRGVLCTIAALALAIDVDPSTFFSAEDEQVLRDGNGHNR